MGDDALDTIMSAGASFFADPELSHIQADIVINDNQIRFLVHLIIVHQLPDTLSAQIHKGLRLCEYHSEAVDHTPADERPVLSRVHCYMVFLRNFVYDIKPYIVPGPFVF